jgi:hypothetical protein
MRLRIVGLMLLVVAVAVPLRGMVAPEPAMASPEAVVGDFLEDGVINGSYSASDLANAPRLLKGVDASYGDLRAAVDVKLNQHVLGLEPDGGSQQADEIQRPGTSDAIPPSGPGLPTGAAVLAGLAGALLLAGLAAATYRRTRRS